MPFTTHLGNNEVCLKNGGLSDPLLYIRWVAFGGFVKSGQVTCV